MTASVSGVSAPVPAPPDGEPGAAPAAPALPAFGPLLLLLLGIGAPGQRPEGQGDPASRAAGEGRDDKGPAGADAQAPPAPPTAPPSVPVQTGPGIAAPFAATATSATGSAEPAGAPAVTLSLAALAGGGALRGQADARGPGLARHAPSGEADPVVSVQGVRPGGAEPDPIVGPPPPTRDGTATSPSADPAGPSVHGAGAGSRRPPPEQPERPVSEASAPRRAATLSARPVAAASRPGDIERDGGIRTGEGQLWPARRPEAAPAGEGRAPVLVEAGQPRPAAPDRAAVAPAAPVEASPPPEVPLGEQVVRAARLVVSDGLARLDVELDPPDLGAIRITADLGDGGLGLRIVAERAATQTLLVQALPDIHARLAAQGMGAAVVVAPPPAPERPGGRREGWRPPRQPDREAVPPPRPAAAEAAESIDFVV